MPTENDAISENKIAIVTGGSRGIGRNTVLSLAKRGTPIVRYPIPTRDDVAHVVERDAWSVTGCLGGDRGTRSGLAAKILLQFQPLWQLTDLSQKRMYRTSETRSD
jgi:NAD(P)-dependent dehydrogenase (short-subunit alcohol dehydrogenase family)